MSSGGADGRLGQGCLQLRTRLAELLAALLRVGGEIARLEELFQLVLDRLQAQPVDEDGQLGDQIGLLPRTVLIDIRNADVRTVTRQSEGRATSDAGAAAGNERNFAVQGPD